MIVAVMPGDRRDVVAPLAARQVVGARLGGLGHQRMERVAVDRPPAVHVHVGHPEGRRQRLGGLELAGQLVAERRRSGRQSASPEASMTTDASIRRRPALVATTTPSTRPSRTVGVLDEGVQQDASAGRRHERLPGDLEMVGVVGDAGAGAVGVGALDDRTERPQRRHDLVADAADDLARRLARRVEAVEGVEDGRARAAQEGQLLEEQVEAPARAAAMAAVEPAEPEPTTRTSTRASMSISRCPRFGTQGRRGCVGVTWFDGRYRPAAIDGQQLPGDARRVVGQQEERSPSDISRVDEAAGKRLLPSWRSPPLPGPPRRAPPSA